MTTNQATQIEAIKALQKVEAAVENIFQAIDDADELLNHVGYFAGFHIPIPKHHPVREGASALRQQVLKHIGILAMDIIEDITDPTCILRAFDGTTVEEERERYNIELKKFLKESENE